MKPKAAIIVVQVSRSDWSFAAVTPFIKNSKGAAGAGAVHRRIISKIHIYINLLHSHIHSLVGFLLIATLKVNVEPPFTPHTC